MKGPAENFLREGFQEMCSYSGHKHPLRGCTTIGMFDERSQNLRKRDCVISWDPTCILLWENGAVIHELKFPKSKQCYISCVAYIKKYNVFFGPSLDMCFNIYDHRLRLIECISHDERVVLGCHYDSNRDFLVMWGGSGVTMWRIKKCSSGSQLESSNSYLLEKVYAFDIFEGWVSKLLYEPLQCKGYAVHDNALTVLDFKKRSVECSLEDLHETPITSCIWYYPDKFYITACMSGIVRCWFVNEKKASKSPVRASVKDKFGATENIDKTVRKSIAVTLHAFNAHSKAVTGMCLHPRPGYLITAGMDSYIKVFDLEAFTQTQSFQTSQGISHFNLGDHGDHTVCLFAHVSGEILKWKIESCCEEFASCNSAVKKLTPFENMVECGSINGSDICYREIDPLGSKMGLFNSGLSLSKKESKQGISLQASSATLPKSNESRHLPQYITDLEDGNIRLPSISSADKPELSEDDIEQDYENYKKNNSFVAFAGHDLQIFSVTGDAKSKCSADSLIDGVSLYTYSMFQQLLFCVLESGTLRVFCTRSPTCILLREINIGVLSTDKATSIALVEDISFGPLRSSLTSKDMRGETSPLNINESIIIGTENGFLHCLDTYQECSLAATLQVSKSNVQQLLYRRSRNELIVDCKDTARGSKGTVGVFKIPELVLTYLIPCEYQITCLGISAMYDSLIIGCHRGSHHLFKLLNTPMEESFDKSTSFCYEVPENSIGKHVEVLNRDNDHADSITGISFCDKLLAYATSSLDSSIKFWDLKKRCLKTILLDVPSADVMFAWPIGHVVVTQREKLLSIAPGTWKNDRSQESADDSDDEEEEVEEPQSSVLTSRASSKRTHTSHHSTSMQQGGLTFLTEDDRDELAEAAFLEESFKNNGNLEFYWRNHSSLNFSKKKKTSRKGQKSKGNGVKLNVRNPHVPIPPRKTKSNFFRRKREKEMKALQASVPSTSEAAGRPNTSPSDDEFDEEDAFESIGDVEDAYALEDLVGRKIGRSTASGKSLLDTTKKIARKFSSKIQSQRSTAISRASNVSMDMFQAVQNVRSRLSGHESGSDAIIRPFGLFPVDNAEPDEMDIFIKPNGPRVSRRTSNTRSIPKK